MSKRAEEAALKAYPPNIVNLYEEPCDAQAGNRQRFIQGYEQAEENIISRIRNQVKLWMPDNPEGDEYMEGKRLAFHSVLVLLDEMEENDG